jgi:hypothetical protein
LHPGWPALRPRLVGNESGDGAAFQTRRRLTFKTLYHRICVMKWKNLRNIYAAIPVTKVRGSNCLHASRPLGDAIPADSIPDTWVTVHSEDMGNTFAVRAVPAPGRAPRTRAPLLGRRRERVSHTATAVLVLGNEGTKTSRACARVRSQTILTPPTAWPLFKRSSLAAFEHSVTTCNRGGRFT